MTRERETEVCRDLLLIVTVAAVFFLPSLATRDLWNPDEPRYMEVAREFGVDAGKRTGFWKRVGAWLDRWCLLGHCHDTHSWHAKQEVLRRLKRTERQKR